MSPLSPRRLAARASFPRVSGDEPALRKSGVKQTLFSPRERG